MAAKDAIFMKVTKDAFEIPLAVADTAAELAEVTGTHRTTILRAVNKKGSGFVKVAVERNEEINTVRNEIARVGAEYFKKAKQELAINGQSGEYARLINIAEGLRIALSIAFRFEQAFAKSGGNNHEQNYQGNT